jgi:hypothetical protein
MGGTMDKRLGYAGAVLLAGGLFAPIVSMPVVGRIIFFNSGNTIPAIALLVFATIALLLTARDRLREVLWPGLAAAGVLIFEFAKLQFGISKMKESLAQLDGGPLSSLASTAVGTVQIQWGWLILGAGAGLLIYLGALASRSEDKFTVQWSDRIAKMTGAASLLLFLGVVSAGIFQYFGASHADVSAPKEPPLAAPSVASSHPDKLSAEKVAYIRDKLQVYDLNAKYYNSLLDGRIPGVRFKIKNSGDRTLNRVTVKIVFFDAAGKAISEEEYHPILVSEYSVGDNKPLRPNYVWQDASDKFYSAKSVPSEWKTGSASATITEIEFAPAE